MHKPSSASIGSVVFINHEVGQSHILNSRTDAAMYQAKEAGRNAIWFYKAEDGR